MHNNSPDLQSPYIHHLITDEKKVFVAVLKQPYLALQYPCTRSVVEKQIYRQLCACLLMFVLRFDRMAPGAGIEVLLCPCLPTWDPLVLSGLPCLVLTKTPAKQPLGLLFPPRGIRNGKQDQHTISIKTVKTKRDVQESGPQLEGRIQEQTVEGLRK